MGRCSGGGVRRGGVMIFGSGKGREVLKMDRVRKAKNKKRWNRLKIEKVEKKVKVGKKRER